MSDDSKRQLKPTQNKDKKQDEDLVDLPEQAPEPTWKQYLMTPKFLLLLIMTIGVLARNIYLEYTKPPVQPGNQTDQKTEEKETEMTEEMFSRFFWYIVLTIILFVVFIVLKRSNDAAEEEKIRAEVQKQEQEAEKQRKIQEKANKIITSMDQFGNVVEQDAFRKKDYEPQASQSQQSSQSKKDQ